LLYCIDAAKTECICLTQNDIVLRILHVFHQRQFISCCIYMPMSKYMLVINKIDVVELKRNCDNYTSWLHKAERKWTSILHVQNVHMVWALVPCHTLPLPSYLLARLHQLWLLIFLKLWPPWLHLEGAVGGLIPHAISPCRHEVREQLCLL